MSLAILPPEILYIILQFVDNDFTTLSNLSAVSRSTYHTLRPLVYRFIRLPSVESVGSFCHVMTALHPTYSTYVTTLRIGPQCCVNSDESIWLRQRFSRQLRCVLESLDGLKSLCLMVARGTLAELLGDLKFTFDLHTFIHSGEFSQPLVYFLERQPSIVRLGWHGSTTRGDAELLHSSIRDNPILLPNLTALEGLPRILTALLPLRPISNVTILPALGNEASTQLAAFGDVLAHSMVPVTRVCTVEDRRTRGTWGWVIVELRERYAASSTLKEIQIVKLSTTDDKDRDWELEGILVGIYSTFLRFNALEKLGFETISIGTPRGPSPSDVHAWLARCEMQCLSSWTRNNPSLRSVTLYGQTIS